MIEPVELTGMGEGELLDFVGARHRARRRAELDLMRAAFQWAVIHNPDTLDPTRRRSRAGRRRGSSAAWAPRRREFAPAALGARMG